MNTCVDTTVLMIPGLFVLPERAGNYLVSNYEAQDQCEYFAGSFAAYVNHPAELAIVAPKTYAFINNMVINL